MGKLYNIPNTPPHPRFPDHTKVIVFQNRLYNLKTSKCIPQENHGRKTGQESYMTHIEMQHPLKNKLNQTLISMQVKRKHLDSTFTTFPAVCLIIHWMGRYIGIQMFQFYLGFQSEQTTTRLIPYLQP